MIYNKPTKYYVDGFTYYGNPSDTGGGYTIFKEDQLLVTTEILEAGFTNNAAELFGVLACAKVCSVGDEIITDSRNTMAWVRSGRPKARPDLAYAAKEARDLINLKKIRVSWCPREQNLAGIYNENQIVL